MAVILNIDPVFDTIPEEFLRSTAETTMKIMSLEDNEVSLLITTNEKIRELNREYLKHDNPTDVIAFLMNEPNPESGGYYLGDVVISAEMAQEQSDDLGHSFKKEMAVLIIHGILHLAGFEDNEKTKKKEMIAMQHKILEKVFNGK